MAEKSQKENLYSSTVLLPKTEFPMKADLSSRELEMIKYWKSIQLLKSMKEFRKGKKEFRLHDGPPYANGNFHVGHALNKILKDIVIKSHHLAGYSTDFIPGWDCHGLPIEVQVLKDQEKLKKKLSPSEIRQECRVFADKYVKLQGEDLTRFLCVWDENRLYKTMSPEYEAKIVEVFGELYKKGYIYKGKKPVYWCIALGTAHAEAEIEYYDHTSPSIYVKFPVANKKNLSVLIWTTTPWTLPANLGISFHPEYEYGIYSTEEFGDLILAKGLKESVESTTNIQLKEKKKISRNELEKMEFVHPFLDRKSKPLFGKHVTLDAGTGCVHTAPGHGMEDYVIGLESGLEPYSPVDDRGRFTSEFSLMEGKNVFEANPLIVELLRDKKALLYFSEIKHSYPHSWRSKKPLIFRATPQWFFSIDEKDLRKKSMEFIPKVKWIPEWGINRIESMVENRPDWCLSRQRNWGVPIPAFRCESCGETNLTDAIINHFVNLVKKDGIEIWYNREAKELLPENTKCQSCGKESFQKENDILDVWFDSGVSSFAVMDERENEPVADLYLEGSDQHRGWFQSSLWPSMALRKMPPYKSVLTHGYVLDEKGHAMSKSLGNVINPTTDIVNVYGADILRLWVASQDFRDDVKISKEGIKGISEQYRKIRNTFRFLLGNLSTSQKDYFLPIEKLDPIDRYLLLLTEETATELKNYYMNYQFHLVYQKLIQFCTVRLSNEYFEIIRDSLYCDRMDSEIRNSHITVLSHLFRFLSVYSAPILSFTAEEAHQCLYGKSKSVMLNDFPSNPEFLNPSLESKFNFLYSLRPTVQKLLEDARQNGKIGKSIDACLELIPENKETPIHEFSLEVLENFYVVSGVSITEKGKSTIHSEASYSGVKIKVIAPEKNQCPRCWKFTSDSQDSLCQRCKDAIV